jgi:hypothetical protein
LQSYNRIAQFANALEKSLAKQVKYYFNKAAKLTNLPPGLLKEIETCDALIHVTFPVRKVGDEYKYSLHFDRKIL